jgi:Ras-related protein Rab-2A
MNYEYLFKYIIIGDSHVGKSSIMTQFVDKKFNYNHDMTIGVDFSSTIININKRKIKINIWDTAGQEAFRSITRSYYKASTAILLVYDITNIQSFNSLDRWYHEIKCNINSSYNPQIFLVGNKADQEEKRQVSYDKGNDFAIKYNMYFCETSAKTSHNIDKIFFQATENILTKIDSGIININDPNDLRLTGIHRGILYNNVISDNNVILDNIKLKKNTCC